MDRETYKKAVDSLQFSPDFQARTEAMLHRRARELEKETFKMKLFRKPAALVAVAALLVVSVSAAVLRLSASQAARAMDQPLLAAAFEDNNAVTVNQTVETGDYAVTLLGLTSGAGLDVLNQDLDVTHTYAVVSLERLDGTPLEADILSYTITPLVSGCAPWAVNNWTLQAGVDATAVDGTVYYLLDANQLGIFADHTVYLAFYDSPFPPSAEKFTMADDGSIAFSKDFQGAHALFTLPLDPTLADPAAAQALLDNWLPQEGSAAPQADALAPEDIFIVTGSSAQ